MTLLRLQLVLVALSASYLTLGVFARDYAADLWAAYGSVMFVLTTLSLSLIWRRK